MSWRPRLRDDVVLVDGALVDATLARRVPVGGLTRALVARLDGTRDLTALREEVGAATNEPPAEVDGALRALLLLNLVAGAGDAVVAAVRAARDAPRPPPQVLPRARFGCVGSGQCCRVYRPGPLSDEDVARLEAVTPALRASYPDLPDGPWIEEREGDDGVGRYLRRAPEGGRCVFLLEDARCGVHAAVGPEAKPDACNMFPFDAIRTIDGLRLFDVSSCSVQATTSAAGATHAEHARALEPLLPERPRLHHPLVLLAPGLPCDVGHLLPLGERLRRALEQGQRVGGGLARGVAVTRAFVRAAGAVPLEADQPQRALSAAVAADPAPIEVAPAEAARAVARVTEALEAAALEGEEADAPLASAFAEACAVWRSFVAAEVGLADGPLAPALRAAARLPVDVLEAERLLRSSLLNRVYGQRYLIRGHLRAGVLRLALLGPLMLAAARVRAQGSGAASVGVDALNAGHWLVSLALARPALERALIAVEDACWAVASGSQRWLWADDRLG